ncbi:hypothetical protein S40293_05406 [Stachybotrys chartarum IBT 40293]|nr:hypothetical protein S40293_05406 [Stachybotrys chartarum IBT 40293]
MADVFGRNATLNASLLLLLVGSALCTAAPITTYAVLLLGRGIQGISAAGLNVVVRTILADRVSLAENAKNWSFLAIIGGIGFGIGPVVGGYLTRADWRWIFAINLPIAVLALIINFMFLRRELLGPQPIAGVGIVEAQANLATRLRTVDVGGQILFLFGFGLVILSLTWGGASFPWASPAVVVPLVLGCLLIISLVLWERALGETRTVSSWLPWQKPMIPWPLLTNRDVGLLFLSECTTGMAMYAVLYFCSIFFIAVLNYDSDDAGVQLLLFLPGVGGGVYTCMFLCNRWPRMTFPPMVLGTMIEAIGVGLLGYAIWTENRATVFGMMALVGYGAGLRYMVGPLHGVGLFHEHRAAIIGLLAVANPFGGTLGLTIMSTVFNNVSGLDSGDGDFSQIRNGPEGTVDEAIYNAKMGVVWAFVAITPLMILSWLCTFMLGNVRFGGEADSGTVKNKATTRPYLWTLWKGNAVSAQGKAVSLNSLLRPAEPRSTHSPLPSTSHS